MLFRAAKAKVAKEGKTMKQVISEFLAEYAKDELEELETFEQIKKEWPA
jgi:hypothetical protein